MNPQQLFLTIAFVFISLFTKAQDKYDFLIIEFIGGTKQLSISENGTEFKKEKVDYANQDKSSFNANPLLTKVKAYQDNGWEVMSFNTQIAGGGSNSTEFYFAYLRKRKDDKK